MFRFPAGSDVIISVLLDVLARSKPEDMEAEILYLYLDNCTRENKNQYVLGICHLLVEYGIFKNVRLGFLPKGHTHTENADAMFGCFTWPLKTSDIYTWEDLKRVCKNAYTPKPEFYELSSIGSYSTKMAAFLCSKIEQISKPRYFNIKRDSVGIVRHWYRRQLHVPSAHVQSNGSSIGMQEQGDAEEVFETTPSGEKWMPFNTTGYIMFSHSYPDIFSGILQVPPTPIDIADIRKLTMKHFSEFFNNAQKLWWEETLNEIEMIQVAQCERCVCFRNLMKDNSMRKTDTKEVQQAKSKIRTKAYKDMGAHLAHVTRSGNVNNDGHAMYDNPVLAKRFKFINGAYVMLPKNPGHELLTSGAIQLFTRLNYLEQEGNACHYVGHHSSTRGPSDRDARRNWAGLDENKIIIFIRAQETLCDLPWGVGLCLTVKKDSEGTVLEFTVHVMDNDHSSRLPESTYKLQYKQGSLEDIAANKENLKRMHCGFTQQHGKGFKPVTETVSAESACEWGPPNDIFKTKKRNVTYIIRKTILKVLHDNPRVHWMHPTPLPKSWAKQDTTNSNKLRERQNALAEEYRVEGACVDDGDSNNNAVSVVDESTYLTANNSTATKSTTAVVRMSSARVAKDKVVNGTYAEQLEDDAEIEAESTAVEYFITKVIGHGVHKGKASRKWVCFINILNQFTIIYTLFLNSSSIYNR